MSISTSTKAELSILADGVNVEIGDSYTVKGETSFTLIDKYSNIRVSARETIKKKYKLQKLLKEQIDFLNSCKITA